jgi:transposase
MEGMKEVLPEAAAEEIALMEKLLAAGTIMHKYAVRIQTVLNRGRLKPAGETASMPGINIITVSRYVKRFNQGGIPALLADKTRRPGKPPISEEQKNEVCRTACQEKPEAGTHWSNRELAKRTGTSRTPVQTILRERGLKPHLVKSFQFSDDPDFEKKLKDVVGLYMNPPEDAIVLCIDEKSQIQALERTRPVLPMLPGVPERQTVDCYRHGTATLFAALDVLSGTVIGECKQKHRASEYLEFLKKADKNCPGGKVLHIIADNYAAHKTKAVRKYLKGKGGRFAEHFTPTHASWLNLVERWFAEITAKRIRRESWSSVKELEKAIKEYIQHWNKSGRRFQWTKTEGHISNSILLAGIHAI